MTTPNRAVARACSNIALSKYWGKSDIEHNLPAVPSISMTLSGLVTTTSVRFDGSLKEDQVRLDDRVASAREAVRVCELLDRVRALAQIDARAEVDTRNDFPTAAGLASSASGFAALAGAACAAAGVDYDSALLSRLARRSSASAARSVYEGFVELPAGAPGDDTLAAKPLHSRTHWDVALVVAVTAQGPKAVGSTEGMERSRQTSPLYAQWVEQAPELNRQVRAGLAERDLDKLGAAMEQSTYCFHACAMSSLPSILYWQPPTLAALRVIQRLRSEGISVWATMDAGPHVKALCVRDQAPLVEQALKEAPGVLHTMVATPGPGIEIERA